MPKPENDLLDAPGMAIVMTQKEDMCVLCRIVLPAVLRLDTFAEKRDSERIQKTPQRLIGSTDQTINLQPDRIELLNIARHHL